MTRYKIRPGVVLAQVCGENLLVATRPARGKCPYVRQLNSTGAYFWSLLEQNMGEEQMLQAARVHYQAEPERLRSSLPPFLAGLAQQGYLIPEEPS